MVLKLKQWSNGELVTTDDKEKAGILSEYFHEVFTLEDKASTPKPNENYAVREILQDISFDSRQVMEGLKTCKSPGVDNISNDILRNVEGSIAVPLTILYNKSIDTVTIPSDWGRANATPIFKKGNKHAVENYRPISLTSVPCKVMESIVKERIVTENQYGFRSRRFCTLQLLEVTDRWSQAMDTGKPVDAIYLDFQKAFDCVPHERLICKLKNAGLSGKTIEWIKAFLRNRTQRVSINGEHSQWTEVVSGVPQGSVIGPTLFLVFINDLTEGLKSNIGLFADDPRLYSEVQNQTDANALQQDLDSICNWAHKWQLNFNLNKCKVLHFGKKNKKFQYYMTKEGIKQESHE